MSTYSLLRLTQLLTLLVTCSYLTLGTLAAHRAEALWAAYAVTVGALAILNMWGYYRAER